MREVLLGVKDGREAGLKIDDTVLAEVLSLLISNAFQRLFRLHDSDGVREAFQILCEASPIGALLKPLTKRFRSVRGKIFVLDAVSQFDHGLWPQYAVEMLMQ